MNNILIVKVWFILQFGVKFSFCVISFHTIALKTETRKNICLWVICTNNPNCVVRSWFFDALAKRSSRKVRWGEKNCRKNFLGENRSFLKISASRTLFWTAYGDRETKRTVWLHIGKIQTRGMHQTCERLLYKAWKFICYVTEDSQRIFGHFQPFQGILHCNHFRACWFAGRWGENTWLPKSVLEIEKCWIARNIRCAQMIQKFHKLVQGEHCLLKKKTPDNKREAQVWFNVFWGCPGL